MAEPLDDRTPEERKRQPTLQELAARKHESEGAGRIGRLRSWATILLGAVALAVLATWFVATH